MRREELLFQNERCLPRFVGMPKDMPEQHLLSFCYLVQCDLHFNVWWVYYLMPCTKNSPLDCNIDAKFQIPPLHSQQHQTDHVSIQSFHRLFQKTGAAHFCFVHFCHEGLANGLYIWCWTNFPVAQTLRHHQGVSGSARWIDSPPHQIHCHRGFHNPLRAFWRYEGIGRTWWRPQWLALEIDALNTVGNARDYIPFWSGQISLKCLRSSSGRWLSTGTQYL